MKLLAIASFSVLAALSQAQYHFAVKVTGKGKPVILIPGLSCGPDVWDATVARLPRQARHERHERQPESGDERGHEIHVPDATRGPVRPAPL